jgi:hypothetical protein
MTDKGICIEEIIINSLKSLLAGRVKCYQDWCGENNEHACSERFLGLRLKELGLGRKRAVLARHRDKGGGCLMVVFPRAPFQVWR